MSGFGGLIGIALLLTPVPAMAQGSRPPIESALLLGPSPYDLSGTGTGFAVNAGIAVPVLRQVLLLEPSLGVFTRTSQFGNREHWLFPELSLQAQARVGGVRPYLGGGIGAGTVGLSGPARWRFTLHGLAGVRAHLSGRWGVRGELRVRSVDPFQGNTVDLGIGVTRTSF